MMEEIRRKRRYLGKFQETKISNISKMRRKFKTQKEKRKNITKVALTESPDSRSILDCGMLVSLNLP